MINYKRFTYTGTMLIVDQTGDLTLYSELEKVKSDLSHIFGDSLDDTEEDNSTTLDGEQVDLLNVLLRSIK